MSSFSEGPQRDLLLSLPKGTQMYVEADAKMDTYNDQEGKQRIALNLLQRNFEALSRPQHSRETSTTSDAESHASLVE